MSDDRHDPYRTLLAERMDGPLAAEDAGRLEEHLSGCPACRSVARDYEVDRERMRTSRTPEPPRDLWARTSAALDRELAQDADPFLRPGRGGRQVRVAIGSLVTAMTILAITGGQLTPGGPTGVATATPFAVPAQAVNYVGIADGQLTFYRADVAQVCPPPRLDCADGPDGEAVVRLGSGVYAREMTMNDTGQLFISGRDDLGAEVFAIVTLPSPAPSADAGGQTPGASPDPASTPDPEATPGSIETRNPDLGQDDPPTPRPTDGPDIFPSPSPEGSTDPSSDPSISPPPSPTTAVAVSQAILTDVIATGAAAAWSPDGSTLAFSAMPADHSRGSDVYIWRPGDEQAHAITEDHRSLFASWSGSRIVVSRVTADATAPGDDVGQVLVIDPESGEARAVDLERAWLPSVDPTGRFVIYWRGRLADHAGQAVADDGRLYLGDWTTLDPWPRRRPGDAPPIASPVAGPSVSGTDAADAAEPSADPTADPTAVPAAPVASASAPAEATPADDETATPLTSAVPFVPERPRAVSGRTRDWVVRWAADGHAYAVWTAEPDSKVRGSLVVRSAPSADAPTGVALVERVRAGRAFSLGDQRVAWVAPLAGGDGELWVTVWGERGQGSVRLRRLDSLEAVPAY